MLRAALCDDEADQRAQTEELLRQYAARRPDLSVHLTVFSSGEELLACPQAFDVYVLDVIMPGLSGIELGMKLRERGNDGAIVYLTTSRDYAVDSFLADAFYYLVKPADPEQLFQVLDRAATLLQKRRQAAVSAKTREGLRLLRLDELLYAELSGRAARYHLANGEQVDSVTFHGPFRAQVEPLLADPRFALCGSSFAVNLHYVTAVNKEALTVGGVRVPLSRGYYDRVKSQWSGYWLEGRETDESGENP